MGFDNTNNSLLFGYGSDGCSCSSFDCKYMCVKIFIYLCDTTY